METSKSSGAKARFTDKGDIFSLGVLMLQVATQDPPSCGLVMREGQPEVERRAADLSRLPANHPLRPLILQCLQDDPAKRPSCSEILSHLLLGPHVTIPSVSVLLQPHCACHMSLYAPVLFSKHMHMFTVSCTSNSSACGHIALQPHMHSHTKTRQPSYVKYSV